MKTFGKMICGLLFVLSLVSADALAAASKGGFSGCRPSGGGFHSSGGSRSGSWSSPKSSGWSSSPKSSSPKSSGSWSSGSKSWSSGGKSSGSFFGTDTVKTHPKADSTPSWSSRSGSWSGSSKPSYSRLSEADKALADKAKQSGTSYSTRGDAEKAFREKYASQYTTSYAAEPTARPTYVPTTTVYGGNTYNIIYDRNHRGYGYYRGTDWVMYDALMDAAILNNLMNSHSYYYPRQVEYVNTGSDADAFAAGTVLLLIVGGLLVVAVIGVVVKS